MIVWAALAALALADPPPLLAEAEARAIASEVSGERALRTVEALALHHRMRGSEGFDAAADEVLARARGYGLETEAIALPADGEIFYGTQRSRPAWNARFAELWDLSGPAPVRVADWASQPISLAQDSVSGRAEAELVDIGAGTSDADYAGKQLRGRLVLTSSQPSAVAERAVGRHGAAGIVSWAQNQRTAWWGEDRSLVRWGHLDTFGAHPTFAFMVSPAQAAAWRERLARGEPVRLRAAVDAGREPGFYRIPSAFIPGREAGEEIVFSCHLDHPRPGANDNASGCAGILEVARALHRLIESGRLERPRRGLRFVWPAEIEATIALLVARPEFAARSRAAIHLDMIGGDTEITKSILRVYGSPPSLPSFVDDVAFATARWVNRQSLAFASTGAADFPLVEPSGSRRALQAEVGGYNEGSDHQVWAEGSWRIPTVYVADWPDRYIHTQRDMPGNLDPTKMRRAIYIAAASAWILANLGEEQAAALGRVMEAEALQRGADIARRAAALDEGAAANLRDHHRRSNEERLRSVERFGLRPQAPPAAERPADATPVYRRNPALLGPMDGFGYSWLDDHLRRAGLERPALLARPTAWAEGPSFGYETLNLVDGRRSVARIRDDLAATVGPAPVEEVAAYLATLERLGVIERLR